MGFTDAIPIVHAAPMKNKTEPISWFCFILWCARQIFPYDDKRSQELTHLTTRLPYSHTFKRMRK